MRGIKRWIASVAMLAATAGRVQADLVAQYASTVSDFSSQWSTGPWSANQVLGAPNTFSYGDISTAWAPRPANGTLEFVVVEYLTPVYANQVTVRETFGNGFVYQLDVVDLSDGLLTVWTGVDPSLPGTPVDFTIDFDPTSFLVKGVKVYTDTNHSPSWEEIDSIQLVGSTTPTAVPEPASLAIFSIGALGVVVRHRRNQKQA